MVDSTIISAQDLVVNVLRTAEKGTDGFIKTGDFFYYVKFTKIEDTEEDTKIAKITYVLDKLFKVDYNNSNFKLLDKTKYKNTWDKAQYKVIKYEAIKCLPKVSKNVLSSNDQNKIQGNKYNIMYLFDKFIDYCIIYSGIYNINKNSNNDISHVLQLNRDNNKFISLPKDQKKSIILINRLRLLNTL